MTDITESDIDIIIQIASEHLFLLGQSITTEKRRELASIIDKFKFQKTQILQNQKDVQEYQPIKDFLKSNNFTIPQIELWLAELVQLREKITWYEKNVGIPVTERPIKLQSQHKKLVDAIQLYIDYGNLYDYQKEKLQNLLKESEKE